jgi:hypothetical protein
MARQNPFSNRLSGNIQSRGEGSGEGQKLAKLFQYLSRVAGTWSGVETSKTWHFKFHYLLHPELFAKAFAVLGFSVVEDFHLLTPLVASLIRAT